jgi:hypothetical protein
MDDMIGIAGLCPALDERGAARLDRALAVTGTVPAAFDNTDLLARRDALLALQAA